jgi:hypothetical protein
LAAVGQAAGSAGGAASAFYVAQADGAFEATELTRGPWDEHSQHAGPPSALLGRALDRTGGIEPAQLVRVTYEILGPIPIGRLDVETAVTRPGRRVEMVEGSMAVAGKTVVRARGWRIRTTTVELDRESPEPPRLPGPGEGEVKDFFPTGASVGYHTAMEVRFLDGGFTEPGPAKAWMRMKVPLIEGEEIEPRDRVLVSADSGNGVSAPLDYRRFLFINTDLSVTLRRLPRGEWVGLDAVTYAEPHGVGVSDAMLHDEEGMIGRASQSLLVAERER